MFKTKLVSVALMIMLIAALLLSLQGCSADVKAANVQSDAPVSMFVGIERTTDWQVVYHRDTKVMYAVSDGSYNHGTFTLLVDATGAPLIYNG